MKLQRLHAVAPVASQQAFTLGNEPLSNPLQTGIRFLLLPLPTTQLTVTLEIAIDRASQILADMAVHWAYLVSPGAHRLADR